MILLNITEVAAILRSTEKAIIDLVGQDEIPYRRRGRKLYFLLHELEAWIDDQPGKKFVPVRDVGNAVDTPDNKAPTSTDLHRPQIVDGILKRGAQRPKIRLTAEGQD